MTPSLQLESAAKSTNVPLEVIADALGITAVTFHAWRRGDNPPPAAAEVLMRQYTDLLIRLKSAKRLPVPGTSREAARLSGKLFTDHAIQEGIYAGKASLADAGE